MKNITQIETSYAATTEATLKLLAEALEPYKKMSDTLSASLNAVIKNHATIPPLEINGVSEALRKKMNTFIASDLLTDSMSASIQKIGESFKLYEQPHISDSLKEISESLNVFSKNMALEQLKQLYKIDYSTLFANIIPQSSSLFQILDSTYSIVQDELSECNNEQDDNFTEEELQETLQEQVSNPKGFQERVGNWTEKKKIQFFIIWQLICFIYGNFVQPYFQENIGMPVMAYVTSNVRELPQKGADFICQLKEGIEAVIIENTNYYYKVSFIDENGEKREGYVAKRNLKKIEKTTKKEIEEQQEQSKNKSQN